MNKQRRPMRASLAALALVVALPLAGCGFHLRGTTPDSRLSFDTVHLAANAGTPLERELRGAILSSGAALAADPKSAAVTLRILSETQEKKILTLNAQGQVREYSLAYRLRFEVADKDNRKLLTPDEIVLQAYLSYSESQALAKESEERMTYVDLRRDAVSQVMRQLARVKPEQFARADSEMGQEAPATSSPVCAVASRESCK